MLSVSEQFKAAFRDSRRVVEFKAVVAGVEYTKSDIVELTIRDSIQDGSTFTIGTAISSEMTLALRTTDEIPINAEVRLYLRTADLIWDMVTMSWITADVPWDDASSESIPYGVYYIDKRTQSSSYWQYTCQDALILAEQPFISQLTYPAPMAAVLAEACNLTGIESEIVVDPSLAFPVAPTGYSCRGVIKLLASATAACARVNKEGKLAFVSFGSAPAETVTTSDYSKLKHTNPVKSISRVVCAVDDEGVTLEAGRGTEGNTVKINNPYLDQFAVNAIQEQLNGFAYNPITIDWICLPWIEVGDRVAVQEYVSRSWEITGTAWMETEMPWTGIGTFATTIMTNTIKYRGGLTATISASSDSQQQSEFKPVGTISQQINRLNQSAVKLGKPYYGLTVTKEQGLKIERSDGKSDLTLNSDVMDWRVDGESSLYYDAIDNKLKFRGDIVMQGGSISWESVNAPTPEDVGALTADDPKLSNLSDIGVYLGVLHQGQIDGLTGKLSNLSSIGDYIGALSQGQVQGLSTRLTKITETGVYAGTVGTDQLIAGSALIGSALIDKIRANQIDVAQGRIAAAQIEQLVVGQNVQMGAGATISWGQVTNQPTNIYNPSYLQSTHISSTMISSPSIAGGNISIGSLNNIFKADHQGIYLGNASFGSAPFRVNMTGQVTASNIRITGGNITDAANINITSDARIGNNLHLGYGTSLDEKTIYLKALAQIYTSGDALRMSAPAGVYAGTRRLDVASVAVFG